MILLALTAHQTPTSKSRIGKFMNYTRNYGHQRLLFRVCTFLLNVDCVLISRIFSLSSTIL